MTADPTDKQAEFYAWLREGFKSALDTEMCDVIAKKAAEIWESK